MYLWLWSCFSLVPALVTKQLRDLPMSNLRCQLSLIGGQLSSSLPSEEGNISAVLGKDERNYNLSGLNSATLGGIGRVSARQQLS